MARSLCPAPPSPSVETVYRHHMAGIAGAAAGLEPAALSRAAAAMVAAIRRGQCLYVCGNGGSAAIANHMVCDILKGARTGDDAAGRGLRPRIVSLSSQVELITAIANDLDYADIFVYPLRSLARPGDALIAVSASGNSENVVRALAWAGDNGLTRIALTGFTGGRAAGLTDIHLHIPSDDYGIVEDLHQAILHVLTRYLRLIGLAEDPDRTQAPWAAPSYPTAR